MRSADRRRGGGAVADTVPATAGLLVPSRMPGRSRDALRRFLTEPGVAESFRAGALRARCELPIGPTRRGGRARAAAGRGMSDGFYRRLAGPARAVRRRRRAAPRCSRAWQWRLGADISGWSTSVPVPAPTCANASTLGGDQDWALVELDPALIAAGQARLARQSVAWRYHQIDLARDLERLGALPVDLIAASALIDLVGAAWLRRLVA